ncbi:MAG: DUF2184 domain-containing protein [Treponema sp.]|nr:DUF2184 domain-containing protein [Treponema sp.]
MSITATRLDSRESAFFARETEYVKSRTYDAKPSALKGLSLVPQARDLPEGISEITYRRYTEAGEAKIIANYAKDFPRVDVYGEEDTVKVFDIGDSYGYSIKEIRESSRSGKRLDQRRALAARNAVERKLNDLTLRSNRAAGTYGILDFPGLTETTLPADGTGGSKKWSDKDVDKIIRDINVMLSAVIEPTKGAEVPDTLLLPLPVYTSLQSRRLGDTESSLIKYVTDSIPMLKKIDWLNELGSIGSGGTGRVMVGCFDEMHCENQIVSQFEQGDVQQEGMEFKIPCMASSAGVIVYYPGAFAFADGIC